MVDKSLTDYRGVHDLGGLLCEPFAADEHDYAPWEKRVHAVRELLATKGLLRVDELRRAVEGLGAEKYQRLTYYEQWIWAMSQIMLERGLLTDAEIGARVEEVRKRVGADG
ncbi:SH3-like domain-containing protein [uncultured Ruegeria sp.]|uniref:SH3-like domain-containing protein n=1 Tax=uncultured Ruegeria sp. TaxID=259304 RepID=UPI00260E8B80|nr:SH3-like domain-containing protein [uncultured Ruegeria sp.]